MKYVDPEIPIAREERKKINSAAWKRWTKNKSNFAVYLIAFAINYLLAGFGAEVAAPFFRSQLAGFGAFAIILVIGFLALWWALHYYRFAPLVRLETCKHGYDVCLKCGYWLRGLPDDAARCPECGAEREPMPEMQK